MIGLFGPPPRELLDESEAVVQWKWIQPVKNDKGKVCRSLREYYGGPFFDKKGKKAVVSVATMKFPLSTLRLHVSIML